MFDIIDPFVTHRVAERGDTLDNLSTGFYFDKFVGT